MAPGRPKNERPGTAAKVKRQMRATIVDVAEKAGVHVSTASRALNPKADHRISDDVVSKIHLVARKLGYQRNPMASGLRTQRSDMIGLIVPNLSDPLFSPVIAAVEESVARKGYVTFVAGSAYKADKLISIVEVMSRQYVAGLIVCSFNLDDPAADLCVRLGIPTVAVLRDPHHPAIPSITMDDEAGVRSVVEHIVALGHRSITYVTAPLAASTARNRLRGFHAAAQALKARRLRFRVVEAEAYDVAEGRRVMSELIADGLTSTAFVFFNDLLATGALSALKSAGIACPEQVAVSGVNDLPFMDVLSPPLTSVRCAGAALGSQGADLLLRLIEDGKQPIRRILLPSEPVFRDSTGPVRAGAISPSGSAEGATGREREPGRGSFAAAAPRRTRRTRDDASEH